jgi:hypothetical protein
MQTNDRLPRALREALPRVGRGGILVVRGKIAAVDRGKEVTMGKIRLLGLLLAAMLLLGGAHLPGGALAAPGDRYTAPLSGGEEVPPRTTPASGQATFEVSADGQSLTYSITVRDITNVTAGHIHLGAKGTNGDIILPLVPSASPGNGPRSGVIGQGTATAAQLVGPLQGKTMADLIAAMDAGNAYVNIHTASGASPATLQPGDIPPGEIRGQIALAQTAPGTMPATGGGYGARTMNWSGLAFAVLIAASIARVAIARRRAA